MNAKRIGMSKYDEYLDYLRECDIVLPSDEVDEESVRCEYLADLGIADSLQFSPPCVGRRPDALRMESGKPWFV